MECAEEQRQRWNGAAGRAWVASQAVLDRLFEPLADRLADLAANTDVVDFQSTDAGLLGYRSGSAGTFTLVWVNRGGAVTPFARALRGFVHPRVSPDGRRVVATRGNDLWLYDLPRDTLSQLTFQGGFIPLWTPDGRRAIYGRARPGTGWDIFWKPADGSGSEQELVARPLLMVRQPDAGDSTVRLNIVVNWFEELKEKTR